MRLVTEQELKDIEQGLTMRDIVIGLSCASITGLVIAAFLWFCLAIGVG